MTQSVDLLRFHCEHNRSRKVWENDFTSEVHSLRV